MASNVVNQCIRRANEIVNRIYDKWESYRSESGGLQFDTYFDNNNALYTKRLYDIVSQNLDDAIEYDGESFPGVVPMDVELVSKEEFNELMHCDMTYEQDKRVTRLIERGDDTAQFKATKNLQLITMATDMYANAADKWYDRFNCMIHGVFANPKQPKPQYITIHARQTVSLAGTLITNAGRRVESSDTIMASYGSNLDDPQGPHAFVIGDMLTDAIAKISGSAAGMTLRDSEKVNVAAELLRYGSRSANIVNRYPLLLDGSHGKYITDQSIDNGRFTRLIENPAFMTYDPEADTVHCPQKLYQLLANKLNFTRDNVSLKVETKFGMRSVEIKLTSGDESMARRLNRASQDNIIVPIYSLGGVGSSIDAAVTNEDGSSDSKQNVMGSSVNAGMEELSNSAVAVDSRRDSYIGMVKAMTKLNVYRILMRDMQIRVPAADVLKRMPSSEAAEVGVNVADDLISLMSNLNDLNLTVERGEHDGHACISVKDASGKLLSADDIMQLAKNMKSPGIKGDIQWCDKGINSLLDRILNFVYYVPKPTDTPTGVSVDSPEMYDPSIRMSDLAESYINDVNDNQYLSSLVSAYIRAWAEDTITKYRPATLARYASNIFLDQYSDMDGDAYDAMIEDSSELVRYISDVSPKTMGYIDRMINTIGANSTDRRQLLSDWFQLLTNLDNANAGNGLEDDGYDPNDRMKCSDIIDRYLRGDASLLIKAFPGKFGDYLSKYFSDPEGCNKDELRRDAMEIYSEQSNPYVEFDNAIASELVHDAEGKTLGKVSDYYMPSAAFKNGRRDRISTPVNPALVEK